MLSTLEVAREPARVRPPGTVNVVTGAGRPVGEAITGHDVTGTVSVTGSVATGRAAMAHAAETITPVSLELDGDMQKVLRYSQAAVVVTGNAADAPTEFEH